MAATSYSKTFDARGSTIAEKIYASGAVQNAISNSNPTFYKLARGGKVKKMAVGGDQLMVNLMYELNEPKSYSHYEPIDVTPNDGVTRMYVPWAQYGKGMSVSGMERFQNQGDEKIADLVKTKATQMTYGWAEKFSKDIWDIANLQATHPHSGNSGKNMIGIPLWVQALGATAHPSGAGSTADHDYDIGHIDQSAETWWQNKIHSTGATNTYKALTDAMRHLFNNCSQNPMGSPNLIPCDQVSFEIYESGLDEKVQYTDTKMASAGFENVKFKTATMYWDGYVPDAETPGNGALSTGSALAEGSMYFLNTNSLCLYMGKGHDFKPRGFMTPHDQDASSNLYLAYLQLVCTDRRKNGVLYAIEPTIVT